MTAPGAIERRRGSRPAPTLAGGERPDIALDSAVSVVVEPANPDAVLALLGL